MRLGSQLRFFVCYENFKILFEVFLSEINGIEGFKKFNGNFRFKILKQRFP